MFGPKSKSWDRSVGAINSWISTGIHNDGNNTDLFSVKNLPYGSKIPSSLPRLMNHDSRLNVLFKGNYMKQTKVGYTHGSGLNIYMVYKLTDFNNKEDLKTRYLGGNALFTAQNCLFGAVKIIKDATDGSKYKYSGYGVCFDSNTDFSFSDGTKAKIAMVLSSSS